MYSCFFMIEIHQMTAADADFHREMFYASLFVPYGEPPFPPEIINKPGLKRYLDGFGGKDFYGILMKDKHQKIGAAWVTFWRGKEKGYGYVEDDIPELGIAFLPSQRGKGLGTRILTALIERLKEQDIPGLSLSTDRRNAAVHLYKRFGFQLIHEDGDSMTMLLRFTSDHTS